MIVSVLISYRYNNKTYRIDDIAWDKCPESKFEYVNGEEMSYIEYYKYIIILIKVLLNVLKMKIKPATR